MLRAVVGARLPLAALAFASGCMFAVWAVVMAPLIAGAAPEKRRATAFSVFFASMISTGIAGNWLGGVLPSLFTAAARCCCAQPRSPRWPCCRRCG